MPLLVYSAIVEQPCVEGLSCSSLFLKLGNMSIYAKTLKSVREVKTISAHMVALGKIYASSEDEQLNQRIQALVTALEFPFNHGTGRSTPTSLTFRMLPATYWLIEYCKFQRASKKPEWQILAEQNGWIPPAAQWRTEPLTTSGSGRL